ncbi:hypothetical protein [Fodinicola feengrottensis]|uniref:hypothetical protein n=2 Tax=Fodinicola feengrottensis TaxID=435914 RepID=UPI0024430815|nr:hypothetical protein [Fodinicola feengrottensis]
MPAKAEAEAAWELYTELISRVSVVPLPPDQGLLRDALTSLYSLFDTTRGILRKYGPDLAPRHRQDDITFGRVAFGVLNTALRLFMTKWHPELKDWEFGRPAGVGPLAHERAWARAGELRAELEEVRVALLELAKLLADVANVAYFFPEPPTPPDPENRRGGGIAESLSPHVAGSATLRRWRNGAQPVPGGFCGGWTTTGTRSRSRGTTPKRQRRRGSMSLSGTGTNSIIG